MNGRKLQYNSSSMIFYSAARGPRVPLTQRVHVSAIDVSFSDRADALNIEMKASIEQGKF